MFNFARIKLVFEEEFMFLCPGLSCNKDYCAANCSSPAQQRSTREVLIIDCLNCGDHVSNCYVISPRENIN